MERVIAMAGSIAFVHLHALTSCTRKCAKLLDTTLVSPLNREASPFYHDYSWVIGLLTTFSKDPLSELQERSERAPAFNTRKTAVEVHVRCHQFRPLEREGLGLRVNDLFSSRWISSDLSMVRPRTLTRSTEVLV